MAYTQDEKLISIKTPLGKDTLLLTELKGREEISRLFSFDLAMLSEKHDISFEAIIGQNVTVSLSLADGSTRYFNGIIASFSQGRGGDEKGGDPRFSCYRATLVPWVWVLTKTTDIRIFQSKSVADIIDKVFKDQGVKDYRLKLQKSYPKRDYCVQYRETDFNFVSRLMEEEGIFYFFEHEDAKHTMVISDDPSSSRPCPGQKSATYQLSGEALLDEDVITSLELSRQIRVGKYSLTDYNFEIPGTDLSVVVPSKTKLGPGEREIYDFPGLYGTKTDGDRLAKIRMEAEEAQITKIAGGGSCRAFTSGYRFTLTDHYRRDLNNKDYLLVSVIHEAVEGYNDTGHSYCNSFECIPYDVPFRPQCTSHKPFVKGAQTAIVVGPSGEEIYPDKHGRVKVQFHWDREGKKDDKSSCWIRVSQAWAGSGWGAICIPRIGQEVVVDFLEGDPDRPIITGRVYHGANTPPYPLPDDKTRSVIKSESSKGGGGFNELRFEDKKGNEEIFLHGQKDWTIAILNDKNQTIGNNETLQVVKNQTESIGANKNETVTINKTETIGAAKELTIGGGYQVSVGAAMNETVGGAKAEEIGAAKFVNVGAESSENVAKDKSVDAGDNITENAGKNMSLVSGENFSINGGKNGTIEIADQLTIVCGDSSITMKKNGTITIKGKDIIMTGSGKISAKASSDLILKGSKVSAN
ncbi:putative type VI secretion system protein VgrGB [Geobacter sp. OR-1]|uniref:type VI secretion system Vgr family protein n=1 Tax=Geobacter sp. OR-1 TaxID=1266765 RepID=UPI000542E20D|nr:type VI secretion system tip protein VgrG [Geobacter sp. OR-1]GAM09405.1 putative type VI secretion system protein VgrGB [Geobacter sp. OR-1]